MSNTPAICFVAFLCLLAWWSLLRTVKAFSALRSGTASPPSHGPAFEFSLDIPCKAKPLQPGEAVNLELTPGTVIEIPPGTVISSTPEPDTFEVIHAETVLGIDGKWEETGRRWVTTYRRLPPSVEKVGCVEVPGAQIEAA